MQNITPTDSMLVQGWTSPPDGRGTIDILYTCVLTIFLCTWSVLCINVPAIEESDRDTFVREIMLAGLGLLGPELILQLALGQWMSARRSVTEFRASGLTNWTIKHAFFADMGGIILHTGDFPPFPIDAKQTCYLVHHKHIEYPRITKKDIKDRNKVVGLLRLLTVAQIAWFVINCVARAVQSLVVTTFELTTTAFIFCTFGTHVFWAHKPADVQTPMMIHCDTSISQILINAGDAARLPYNHTPLDFVSRNEWIWSLCWNFLRNKLRKMGISLRPTARPMPRIPNDHWPDVPAPAAFGLILFDLAYAAIYLSGWNFWFPTRIERILWRVATTVTVACILLFLLVEAHFYYLAPLIRRPSDHSTTQNERSSWLSQVTPRGVHLVPDWIRNSSPNRDPQYYVLLKIVLPLSITAILYCLSRAYILVECLLVLRELPASAYQTVSWSGFLPHV